MMGLGTPEIILIAIVILVFFGAKKIPEMAKGLGSGIKEFRKGMKDVQSEIENESPSAPSSDKQSDLDKRELELLRREAELRKKLEEKK